MPELNPIDMLTSMNGASTPLVGWVIHFLTGTVAWGALFAWINPSLPGGSYWLRGAIFAVGAWLLIMIIVMPMEPAASLPYLPDVARLERAWSEAYHARDAAPLAAEVLADISSDRVANACFTAHPSLRVVASWFPALTIWRMNVDDGIPGPVDLGSGAEDALVMRPQAAMEVRSIPPGAAEFLTALADGRTLVDATRSAMNAAPYFDLSANIAALISAGAFVDYSFAENA
jgi:Family of unknown function (DUF6789)